MWFKKKEKNKQNDINNKEFVELCYEKFLERPCDFQGRENYIEALKKNLSRLDLIKSLVSGAEYYTLLTKKLFGEKKLQNLIKLKPSQYKNDKEIQFYKINSKSDFNWIENKIISEGYYESVGVWSFAIDNDKKIFSEIVEKFKPENVLDIGCSTGSILKLLSLKKINCDGIEISHLAIGLSYREITNKIFYGDILELNLKKKYDIILGLDIFEHLNPNKLSQYITRCCSILNDNGFLITNIPAYGVDEIFGEIFPITLEQWKISAKNSSLFDLIPTDDSGWPENGHLALATSDWWVNLFNESGLKREKEIEMAIHKVYDNYWTENSPSRKSIYIFSKGGILKDKSEIIKKISETESSFAFINYS